jgi:hypothetical protein
VRRRRRNPRHKGYTRWENIATVAVLGLIAYMLWQSVDADLPVVM